MARTQTLARLGFGPGKPAGRAGVDNLMITKLGGGGHLRDVPDKLVLYPNGHMTITDDRRQIFNLAPFRLPFGEPTIQNRDVFLPHQTEQTTRRVQPTSAQRHHKPRPDDHRPHPSPAGAT